jgi:hypothetical protein
VILHSLIHNDNRSERGVWSPPHPSVDWVDERCVQSEGAIDDDEMELVIRDLSSGILARSIERNGREREGPA